MARPPLEVADLVRAAGDAFLERNRHWLRWKHVKVLLAIRRCRTAALGGHLDECTRCGYRSMLGFEMRRSEPSVFQEGSTPNSSVPLEGTIGK